jgi:endonuclease/exonuclease/phosphatase family metal-dependent hydrolase
MVETKSPQHAYNFWIKHRIGRTTATQSFKPFFAVLPASTEASELSTAIKWIPLLLGDFNTTPNDPAYGILITGELTKEHIEDLNESRLA